MVFGIDLVGFDYSLEKLVAHAFSQLSNQSMMNIHHFSFRPLLFSHLEVMKREFYLHFVIKKIKTLLLAYQGSTSLKIYSRWRFQLQIEIGKRNLLLLQQLVHFVAITLKPICMITQYLKIIYIKSLEFASKCDFLARKFKLGMQQVSENSNLCIFAPS